jgi:CHU_C Type IX secretion signal domain
MRVYFLIAAYIFFIPAVQSQTKLTNLFVNSSENIVRLDFTTNPPGVNYMGFGSGKSIGEGIAHMENDNGELVLLVNSSGVYDRDGTRMPGSEGILADPSTTEIVVCQKPESDHLYYIIYNEENCSALYYSVVDLTARGGLGDVTELNKVIDNQNTYAEGLEIVRIPCSNDYYLLSYRCYTGITRFRITSSGFSTPTLVHALNTNKHGGRGELDYHKGKIGYGIAFTNKAFVADFDATTGAISNPLTITFSATNGIYGLEFSPEAKRLFVTDLDNRDFFGNVKSANLFSYDFANGNISSWTLSNAGTTCALTAPQGLGQIELGKDHNLYIPVVGGCKIYVVRSADDSPVIDFIETSSVLSTGISDHIQSEFLGEYSTPDLRITSDNGDLMLCSDEIITLRTQDQANLTYQWFKDNVALPEATTSLLEVNEPGSFSVHAIDDQSCAKASPSVEIEKTDIKPFDLGDDVVLCPGESHILTVPVPPGSVVWNDGDTSPVKTVTTAGEYSATISQNDCSQTASATVSLLEIDTELIPNVITPDGNPLNEYFILPWEMEGTQIHIYNRWGKLEYSSSSYQNDWNAPGLSGAVYYYRTSSPYSCLNYKGWIHVIR